MKRQRLSCIMLLAGVMSLWIATSSAQEGYPSKTVRIVVPAAGGSTTDSIARILADQLNQKWGRPVMVENVSGGAMNIGSAQVARAEPDGHTLLIAPPSPLAINKVLFKDPGYDPTQFVPITLLAKIPNALVVRKDLPASNTRDFIAYAKANPGKLSYASQGIGSTAHLSANQLALLADIQMVHVPYRGAVPALNDLIAGHVDLFFDTLTTSVPLHQEGKVKILAVGGAERSDALPEVPTLAESGLPDFRSVTWFGLVAPPSTPTSLVERVNRDVVDILQKKEVLDKMRQIRLLPGATSPAETKKFFMEETELWSKVIRDAKIPQQ